jgi:hypothetical protein
LWTLALLSVTNAEPDATNDLSTHIRLRDDTFAGSEAVSALRRLLAQAEEFSVEGFRRAGEAAGGGLPAPRQTIEAA